MKAIPSQYQELSRKHIGCDGEGSAEKDLVAKLTKSGQVGYIEPLTARLDFPADGRLTPDINLMGFDLTWVSSITPTKEQLLHGKFTTPNGPISAYIPLMIDGKVVTEATGAYCVRGGNVLYVVSTVLENELGTLPKTGLYISSNIASENDEIGGQSIIFDFGETVHTIDPKYLPNESVPNIAINPTECISNPGTYVPLENMLVGMTLEQAVSEIERAYANGSNLKILCYLSATEALTFETNTSRVERIDFSGLYVLPVGHQRHMVNPVIWKNTQTGVYEGCMWIL